MSKRRCKHCREYFDRDGMVIRGMSAYCSNEHLVADLNSVKYKSTISKRRNADLSSADREAIFRLDGHRCRYCGKHSRNLAVHHIYYRSEAKHEPWLNQPHNLITLCNYPCHLDIVHGNKRRYQALCLQVVWLRMLKNDKETTIAMLERQLNEAQ
jgi:5-methylcytosine-specific restriction endonuclease McrA